MNPKGLSLPDDRTLSYDNFHEADGRLAFEGGISDQARWSDQIACKTRAGRPVLLDAVGILIYLTIVNEEREMIRYPMLTSPAASATLAGSAMGRQMLAQLIEKTRPMPEPTIAFLDFADVDIATGSFLREAVMGFRDFCRNAAGMIYPVVANANSTIEEELSTYLRGRNDAIWACSLDPECQASDPHILGELDAGQMNTIQIISQHHPISAPELAKLRPDDKIGTTAWNNRLATLSAKGMLKEMRHGKTKLFSPVMETI